MSKPKATKAEMEARTTAVLTMLVNGAERPEIIKQMAEKHQLNERSTDEAIKRATAVLEAEAKVQRKYEIGRAVRLFKLVTKKALNVQDYRVAISAQKELNTLLGLYPPAKVQVTDWRDEVVQLLLAGTVTREQVRSELGDELANELFERTGARVIVTGEG